MDLAHLLPLLLGLAVLAPLVSFFIILVLGPKLGKSGEWGATVAVSAIAVAAVLSFTSLGLWLSKHWPASGSHGDHHAVAESVAHADGHGEKAGDGHHDAAEKVEYFGDYWLLGQFGSLRVTISYYIDALTIVMFCMVTLIATCIHFYAMGYMHDELHDIVDHEVTLKDGSHLHRPGRFHRFFQYLSLFCFSMLGLVLAGNIAMVFVFWELVGACSYFLIGFYVERKSASTAANKAFIVNRVGDFGMIIGLMALWSSIGTFSFPEMFAKVRSAENHHQLVLPSEMIYDGARAEVGNIIHEHVSSEAGIAAGMSELDSRKEDLRDRGYGYWLLIVAGLGIFCGCVGKSAQFPLHVWLPDAMEGPTPVSALVHSATMVAAGVYLTGRFFPVFAPEVLLTIAIIGTITLFIAASIAITATDIKRVLAYSTVSQLGYMMMSLGVGGWVAGLMHLVTHAFFKSLLFMCSGSVIHAVHTNDMRKMGGLLKKMPVTAITMLIGCLAIAGVGLPAFIIGLPVNVGFSGYYSKDAILEQAYSLLLSNSSNTTGVFFFVAAGGAAMTSFYMFRMWYMTFVGKPRDAHAYDHAHESPAVMYLPLVLLSVFAVSVAWTSKSVGYGLVPVGFLIYTGIQRGWFRRSHGNGGHDSHHDDHGHHDSVHSAANSSHELHGSHAEHSEAFTLSLSTLVTLAVATILVGRFVETFVPESSLSLRNLLESARPIGTAADVTGKLVQWTWPNEHTAHLEENHSRIVVPVTLIATLTWLGGIGLATALYATRYLNPEDVRKQFDPIYRLLVNKWWFDEIYDWLFVRPTHLISRLFSGIDKNWLDWIIDGVAKVVRSFSVVFEKIADKTIVDGLANLIASWTYALGLTAREVQTGRVRQYVLFIAIGALAIFVLISFFWNPTTLAR